MATTVLVGAQWGDEGEGKIIDVLTDQADLDVLDTLQQCTPVYQEFDGWQAGTKHITDIEALPKRARLYLQKLAQLSSARLSIVSVGAGREETIFL